MAKTKVSPNMLAALMSASEKNLASWDFGAGTIGSLKRRGWIRQVDSKPRGRIYETTPEGEAALREAGIKPKPASMLTEPTT